MTFKAYENRYNDMIYNRCGRSGIKLPAISLGLWQNFGSEDVFDNGKKIVFSAFDYGITHFDLANNYGPLPGSAEENFGKILTHMSGYRDEMIISSKAGYDMWPGPYGNFGSKKYLVSSLDQSLKRMGLEYVDIFYHHRPDPETPLEETMAALNLIVRQGKALYAGISNYPAELASKAAVLLKKMGTPCLIHQPKYNMFERWVEGGLLNTLEEHGIGCIAFSPLAQGLLTDKYLTSIPEGSRMSKGHFLKKDALTDKKLSQIKQLTDIAKTRNQSLAQLAIIWLLRDKRVTSVLIGASSTQQLKNNLDALKNPILSPSEIDLIESVLK